MINLLLNSKVDLQKLTNRMGNIKANSAEDFSSKITLYMIFSCFTGVEQAAQIIDGSSCLIMDTKFYGTFTFLFFS